MSKTFLVTTLVIYTLLQVIAFLLYYPHVESRLGVLQATQGQLINAVNMIDAKINSTSSTR